tara:strand:- start:177 stop:287 length:111 start_codon:yes stop_codon:yes gene_type:complete
VSDTVVADSSSSGNEKPGAGPAFAMVTKNNNSSAVL